MKKIYVLACLIFLGNLAWSQIMPTSYRGAFAPAPTAMWTDGWTNFDPQNTVYPTTNLVNVTGNVTTNTTWTTGNTYVLKTQVYVTNNATLTIQPGVVVLGDQIANGAALVVTRGAKLNAIGTATQPIVFTSDKAPGQRARGDWGGVVLLGNGSYNVNGGVGNIEGIAPTPNTTFGGGTTPNDNDNSGILKYVRIEFGGYVYATNAEINGLTMGAVGRATTIEHVQVSYTNDDAFEWFGGSVNCKYLVAFRNLDDDWDADNGYNGVVQFGLSVRDPQISDAPAVSTSEGFEVDNNATGSAVSPFTSAIFSNMTLIGPSFRLTLPNGGTIASGYKRAARLRRNCQIKIYNSVFMDYPEGLHIDGLTTETNALNNTLIFKNNLIAGITTPNRVLQVNSPGTLTAGLNPSFNITAWFAANNNSSQASSAGLLAAPYNASDATIYTGLDYRPATGSPLLSGASFTDAAIAAVTGPGLPTVTTPIFQCRFATPTPLVATANGANTLRWYTVATGGSFTTTPPSPPTTSLGVRNYWVSEVTPSGVEGDRVQIVVNTVAAPSSPGLVGAYFNGTLINSQTFGNYVGTNVPLTLIAPPAANAVSYQWIVPEGVTIVSGQSTNSIVINLSGAPSTLGTFQFRVRSVSSAGCISEDRVYTATKALPGTPAAITTSQPNVCAFVGTSNLVTYQVPALPGLSYNWSVPVGATIVSGQGTDTITVSYSSAFTASGAVNVFAVNALGTSNLAQTLAITRRIPATPGVPIGQLYGVCPASGAYTYTFGGSLYANNWTITAPAGSIITSPSNPTNTSNVLSNTTDTTFSITYPLNYVSGSGAIQIVSTNGCATSLIRTSRVFTNLATPGAMTGPTIVDCDTLGSPITYSVPNNDSLAESWLWTVPAGATIVSGQGTPTVQIVFDNSLAETTLIQVRKVATICGVASGSGVRRITLTKPTCEFRPAAQEVAVSFSEMYPNPATSHFDFTATALKAGKVEVAIYNYTGTLSQRNTFVLSEGENAIRTDVSNLPSGIYVVKFATDNSSEVVTRKLVKR